MDDTTQDEPEAFDPTRRRLCADGSCVGVIGDDGKCRVCGRTEEQAAAGEEALGTDLGGEGTIEAAPSNEGGAAAGFDAKRRLCDDGTCVGVVGDDGKCRVCGRRAD
jgi:hypothetical protein